MKIEIFSDVVCPWCFIGKRRLDAALATPAGDGVEVEWRPYQLHPNVPPGGLDRASYIADRFGANADPGKVPERIRQEAADVGIPFDYARIERVPDTLDAHRLLALGKRRGVQHALAEALFVAYFCEGRDIGSRAELTALAAAAGLGRDEVSQYLDDEADVSAVRREIGLSASIADSGVPCYRLGGTFMLPGAQTPEVMAQIIVRAKDKLG